MKKSLIISSIVFSLFAISLNTASAADSKNPYGASVVDPAGPNDVMLTISKGSKKIQFTYTQLLKLKTSTISIYEPFLKKRQSFKVISLKVLFDKVGIIGKDKVATTALNDYVFTNTASKFVAGNGYLAIQRNGADIPYDQGGPTRIIFPDKSTWAKYLDAWNWSIASIAVK